MDNGQFIDVKLIKRIMIEQGYSVKALAQRTGISEYRLKKFLSGAEQRKIKVDILYQLAVVLNVKAQSLFYEGIF